MGDWRYEALVAVHELAEVLQLINKAGTTTFGPTQEAVDNFDIGYERDREAGKHPADAEPGNDPTAPYHQEHQMATMIEVGLATAMGVDWTEYGAKVVKS